MKKIVVSVIALAFSTLASAANERNQIIEAFDLKLGEQIKLVPISQRYFTYKDYKMEKISYNHYQFVTKNNVGPFKIIDIELNQDNKIYSMYSSFTTANLQDCSWEMGRTVESVKNAYGKIKEFEQDSNAGKTWGLLDNENRTVSVSCKLDNNIDNRVSIEFLDPDLQKNNSIIDLAPSLTKANEIKEGDMKQLKYKVEMQNNKMNKPMVNSNNKPKQVTTKPTAEKPVVSERKIPTKEAPITTMPAPQETPATKTPAIQR